MSAKSENVPSECGVCTEKYNKTARMPVTCGFCSFDACRACYKQYIPTLTEDVKCMSCKKGWDRSFLYHNFDATYINTTLKKRRENILIDRERTLMAETQPAVERIRLERDLNVDIHKLERNIYELNEKIRLAEKHKREKLREFDTEHNINPRNSGESYRAKVRMIKKCTFTNCKGFLSSVWKCGLCNNWTCPECLEVRGTEKNDNHVCNADSLATAILIKSDTRPCPNCSQGIYKIEGCAQMWCTSCNTPFDWNTGRVITGNIHNPHYFEWRRNNHNYDRDPGDIICGREINQRFLVGLYRLLRKANREMVSYETTICEIIRKVIEFKDYEVNNVQVNIVQENRNLRIEYLLDQITEDKLKLILQRKEKGICKKQDSMNIYTMFVQCSTDIIYRFQDRINLQENTNEQIIEIYKEFIDEMNALKNYTNNCLKTLGKVYNSSWRGFTDKFNFGKVVEI